MVLYAVKKNEYNRLNVFVGISFFSDAEAGYAISLQNENGEVTLPASRYSKSKNGKLNYDTICFIALIRTLEEICKSKETNRCLEINYYSGSDMLSFSWEKEYKRNGVIGRSDISETEWKNLIRIVNMNNIHLNIIGSKSMFEFAAATEKRRVIHEC